MPPPPPPVTKSAPKVPSRPPPGTAAGGSSTTTSATFTPKSSASPRVPPVPSQSRSTSGTPIATMTPTSGTTATTTTTSGGVTASGSGSINRIPPSSSSTTVTPQHPTNTNAAAAAASSSSNSNVTPTSSQPPPLQPTSINTASSSNAPTPRGNTTATATTTSNSSNVTTTTNTGRNLTTVKVRNIQSSLMYHLMFDGDISALSGAQLRQHIEGVSGIPADKQVLSLNGRGIGALTTGADINLRNGSTIMLEVGAAGGGAGDQNQHNMAALSAATRAEPQSYSHQNENAYRRESPVGMNKSSGINQPLSHQQQQQYSSVSRGEAMPPLPPLTTTTASSSRHQQQQHTMMNPSSYHGDAADNMDVVVDIVEESDAPAPVPEVGPGFVPGDAVAVPQFRRTAADVEEMRLQQQEYVWKLEQVRFETERMNREREMKRQLMELEYESSLLDRDRVELERHTALEKQKMGHVAAQNRLEMDILQKFFPGSQMG